MFRDIRDPHARLRAVVDAATEHGLRSFSAKDNVVRFVRSAEQMVTAARWKRESGAIDESFYLYVKFSTLYLNKVRQHPSFKQVDAKDQKTINQYIMLSLDEAEKLKPELLKKFEEEESIRQSEEAAEEARRLEAERAEHLQKQQLFQMHRQHHDDAVLAQLMEQEEQYAYARGVASHHAIQSIRPSDAGQVDMLPQVSPAQNRTTLHLNSSNQNDASSSSWSVPEPSAPAVNRAAKPLTASRSGGLTLRKVILPSDLASTFLRLALNNTSRDTETCGILGAPMSSSSSNEMHVSHVLLPPQQGTPDSCTTEDEIKLFEMVDRLNLIVVGWIHTHPSQTAFLSSVDLHTHAGYQHLLPEAVAVVCSVKYNDTKVFRLTPPGLDVIACCDQGGFHTHPGTTTGDPLFDECHPDDLKWDSNSHVQVVDLRA